MESLIPFLKHSNALDLLVITLVILIAVILIPVGIWIVIKSRSRKPIYFFLVIALLPLLLALVGTYLRFRSTERALDMFPGVSQAVVAEARQEAWITTFIGAAGTALPVLIGLTGLVLKKERMA